MAKRVAATWNTGPRKRRRISKKITMSQLPKELKPEVKYSDDANLNTAAFSALAVRPASQGDNVNQFVGSNCFLKALDYSLKLPTTGWTICRVSVLWRRDITSNPTALSPTRRYDHQNFVVLYDEFFTINDKNGIRLKKTLNIEQKYNTTGTAITAGSVYVVFNTDAVVAFDHVVRTYYTDA